MTPARIPAADRPVPYTLTPKARATLDHPAVAFPPVVCLCGSTRFGDQFRAANLRLTLAGQIVLSIGCDTRADADLAAAGALGTDLTQVKARLDDLHKRKIDLSDYVLVLNPGGYIGDSTRSEIAYARATGKPVTYLEPPGGPYCGCGYADCSACMGDGWACLTCGLAYFGPVPDSGQCSPCETGAAEAPCAPLCGSCRDGLAFVHASARRAASGALSAVEPLF